MRAKQIKAEEKKRYELNYQKKEERGRHGNSSSRSPEMQSSPQALKSAKSGKSKSKHDISAQKKLRFHNILDVELKKNDNLTEGRKDNNDLSQEIGSPDNQANDSMAIKDQLMDSSPGHDPLSQSHKPNQSIIGFDGKYDQKTEGRTDSKEGRTSERSSATEKTLQDETCKKEHSYRRHTLNNS